MDTTGVRVGEGNAYGLVAVCIAVAIMAIMATPTLASATPEASEVGISVGPKRQPFVNDQAIINVANQGDVSVKITAVTMLGNNTFQFTPTALPLLIVPQVFRLKPNAQIQVKVYRQGPITQPLVGVGFKFSPNKKTGLVNLRGVVVSQIANDPNSEIFSTPAPTIAAGASNGATIPEGWRNLIILALLVIIYVESRRYIRKRRHKRQSKTSW